MSKRKKTGDYSSDDSRSSASSDSDSDTDKDMLSLAKKKGSVPVDKKLKVEKLSSSSGSESDSDWGDAGSRNGQKVKRKPAKRSRRSTSGTTQSSATADSDGDSDGEPPASDVTSSVAPISAATSLPPPSSSVVSSTVPNADIKDKTPSDLEEGEVSDDDDQGEDSSGEEFNDGYDEFLMGDEEDQKRLNAMTEKEREQEIFKRVELRERLKTRFHLEKKLRRKKAKANRGISDATEDTEEPTDEAFQMDAKVRSQERKKTVESKTDKKTQAMDALKASREAKNQRAQEKEKMRQEQEKKREEKEAEEDELEFRKDNDASSSVGEKKAKKLNASDVYSDDSASESDDDAAPTTTKERRKSGSSSSSRSDSDSEDEDRNRKPQHVEKVEDLNRIRISRFKLEKWLYLPFFEKMLKGCYVKIGVGNPGQKCTYRICEILEVVSTPKIYSFGNSRTNKGLKVKLSGASKVFRFEFVSNQLFTEEDFTKWLELTKIHSEQLPTLDQIQKKEKEFKEAFDYQLQESDIDAIIQEKAKFKNSPVNFAARKTQLMKDREIAVMNGEDDKASKLASEIQELDERAQVLDKVRTSSISSISYINERNRKKNVEEAEKAILEELKSNKGKKVEDPFTRRNTKPRIVSKPNAFLNGNGSENVLGLGTPKLEGGEDVAEKPLEDTIVSLDAVDGTQAALDVLAALKEHDLKSDDQLAVGDLFSAHDFDIQLDLDANKDRPNLPVVARPSMTPIKETAPRRSLNLEEYKRKKGLI